MEGVTYFRSQRRSLKTVCCLMMLFSIFLAVQSQTQSNIKDINEVRVRGFGPCPMPKAKQYFQIFNFIGRWYVHSASKCSKTRARSMTLDLDFLPQGSILMKYHGSINSGVNEVYVNGSSTLTFDDVIKGEAKLTGKSNAKDAYNKMASPYWVLGTDYDVYAVVYSCFDMMYFNTVSVVFLSRRKNVFESDKVEWFLSNINRVLAETGLSTSWAENMLPKNCD